MRNWIKNVIEVGRVFCEELAILLTPQPKDGRTVIDGVRVNTNGPLSPEDREAWRAMIEKSRQSPGGAA